MEEQVSGSLEGNVFQLKKLKFLTIQCDLRAKRALPIRSLQNGFPKHALRKSHSKII